MKYSQQQKIRTIEQIREICTTLPNFCEPYVMHIATRRDNSFRTGKAYAYDLHTFFRWLKEEKHLECTPETLESLKPMDLEEYLSYLSAYQTEEDRSYNESIRGTGKPYKQHKMSASAKVRNLAAIRGLYKHLQKNELIQKNPAALVETPKIPPKDHVIAMDGNQVEEVFQKLENTDIGRERKQFAERQKLRDTALLTFLLYTGCRVSECVGIDLSDIDWKKKSVKILRKTGKYQYVYFNDTVKEALQDYIQNERKSPEYDPDALWVSRKDERMTPQSVGRVVKKYTEGVSADNITTHKLRATYATSLYNATNDAEMVKDALGHANLNVVQKYIGESERRREQAAKEIRY